MAKKELYNNKRKCVWLFHDFKRRVAIFKPYFLRFKWSKCRNFSAHQKEICMQTLKLTLLLIVVPFLPKLQPHVKMQKYWYSLGGVEIFNHAFLRHDLTKQRCSCPHWKGNSMNFSMSTRTSIFSQILPEKNPIKDLYPP